MSSRRVERVMLEFSEGEVVGSFPEIQGILQVFEKFPVILGLADQR